MSSSDSLRLFIFRHQNIKADYLHACFFGNETESEIQTVEYKKYRLHLTL